MSEYCKGHFEFYDYVHKSLLNFYKTNDLTYLKIKFNKFDPEIQAKSILEIIENQTDQSKRFYIAKFQWHTAMNNQYRNFNGKVDWDAFQKDKENLRNYWDMFLKKQSIKKMKIRFINNDIYKD
jgi:predicted metal-dependent hydrolase